MRYFAIVSILLVTAFPVMDGASAQEPIERGALYKIQPGDELEVSVWREPDLQRTVLVRPDGRFSMPLAGDIDANGKSVEDVRQEIVGRLERYIPDLVVTVSVRDIRGNKIFVLGQVNDPGEFILNRSVDVTQALSMAGGTTPFASVGDIIILRRGPDGVQHAIDFNYQEVIQGRRLEQNLILNSGDVVVVP
jgi:polysaccharide export outer membrane protein